MTAQIRRSKRQPLNEARITAAALDLVNREGLGGFSFRTLAKTLGCEAMSIYHYYPSKTHLFDAMLDSCLADVRVPGPEAHWVDKVRAIAHSFRAMALRNPGFFPYLAVHRLNTRFALGFLDAVFRVFEESGQDAEWRAKRFRALGYYLMGAFLDETSGYAKGPTTATPVPDEVIAREFPAVVALGPYFAPQYHAATFEEGLETMLEQMKAESA